MLAASSVSIGASWGQRTEASEPLTAPVLVHIAGVWGREGLGLTPCGCLSLPPT